MFRRLAFVRCATMAAGSTDWPTSPIGLDICINAIKQQRVKLEADDVYKISALITAKVDPLDLCADAVFMQSLEASANALDMDAMNPFQVNVIKDAIAKAHSAAGKKKKPGEDEDDDDDASNAIISSLKNALKEFKARNTYDSRSVASAVEELNEQFKDLEPFQVVKVIDILSQIHYQDFNLTNRMARRACELAGELTLAQKSLCFLRLNKMEVPDALTALVVSMGSQLGDMTKQDASNIIYGVQKHKSADTRTVPLVTKACVFLEAKLQEVDLHLLIGLLEVCAKYEQNGAKHTTTFFNEALARSPQWDDYQLLLTLQAATAMKRIDAKSFEVIHARATALVPSIQPRNADQLLDVMSMQPFQQADFMSAMLDRIAKDSTLVPKLAPSQLCFILQLVASYPPAKGHKALVTLASQAHSRRETLGHEGLVNTVLALTEIGFIGDSFYDIAACMMIQKKGFKTTSEFFEFVSLLKPQFAQDDRMQTVLAAMVYFLSSLMTPEDLVTLQDALRGLGVDDVRIKKSIVGRANDLNVDFKKQLQEQQRAAKERFAVEQKLKKEAIARGERPTRKEEPKPIHRPGMMSPEEMALLGKKKPPPPKQKKKPFSMKRAEWDMDIG